MHVKSIVVHTAGDYQVQEAQDSFHSTTQFCDKQLAVSVIWSQVQFTDIYVPVSMVQNSANPQRRQRECPIFQ